MKKNYKYVIVALALIHVYFLLFYGISWFGTTVLFYYILYHSTSWILTKFTSPIWYLKLKKNLQVLIILFLLIEFTMTFILGVMNNSMEKEYGVYFSEYKRDEQVNLLNKLGWKNIQVAWKDGYKPHTNRTHQAAEFKYSFTTNEIGLRGKLANIKKDTNELRIVILGDSFIEGFGTPNDSTLSVLLQHKLNFSNKKTSIINGGICGSNPFYETLLYKNKLKDYQPNIVILETNINDIYDVEYVINKHHIPLKEYFFAISHIYRGFFIGILNRNVINEYANRYTIQKRNNYINQIVEHLKEFNVYLKSRNTIFILIYLPSKSETINITEDIVPTKKYKKELINSGIPVIDLQVAYKEINLANKEKFKKYYWQKDGHHTPEGYDLMSKIIADKILKNYVGTY